MRARTVIGFAIASAMLVAGAHAADTTPAKILFGRVDKPSDGAPRPIGSYAKGCLAGADALPIDGPHWQVMRLSRNRNWGTPELINYLEHLSSDAAKVGWNGLLIGDMSQPRGGPMVTGHASHQIGLDADIWFTPMPDHVLSASERESMAAGSLLIKGKLAINPRKWSDVDARLLERAASYPEVARIFVSAAIKQKLCDTVGSDRAWLRKLRPWWGHDDHFHVRLTCPPGLAGCVNQAPPPPGDGCNASLAWWFKPHPPPKKPKKPYKPPPELTLASLPAACTNVLYEGTSAAAIAAEGTPLPRLRPDSN